MAQPPFWCSVSLPLLIIEHSMTLILPSFPKNGNPLPRITTNNPIYIDLLEDVIEPTCSIDIRKNSRSYRYVNGQLLSFEITENHLTIAVSLNNRGGNSPFHATIRYMDLAKNVIETSEENSYLPYVEDGEHVEKKDEEMRYKIDVPQNIDFDHVNLTFVLNGNDFEKDAGKYLKNPCLFPHSTAIIDCDGLHFVKVSKEYLGEHSRKFRALFSDEQEIYQIDLSVTDFIEFLLSLYPVKKRITLSTFRAVRSLSEKFVVLELAMKTDAFLECLPPLTRSFVAFTAGFEHEGKLYRNHCETLGFTTSWTLEVQNEWMDYMYPEPKDDTTISRSPER